MAQPLTAQQALARSRACWLAVMGFQAAALFIALTGIIRPTPVYLSHWTWAALGLLPAGAALAFAARSQTYKANWIKNAITPAGYFRAHLLMAVIFGVLSFIGSDLLALHQDLLPGLTYGISLVLLMVLMWPDGKPMNDHPIR